MTNCAARHSHHTAATTPRQQRRGNNTACGKTTPTAAAPTQVTAANTTLRAFGFCPPFPPWPEMCAVREGGRDGWRGKESCQRHAYHYGGNWRRAGPVSLERQRVPQKPDSAPKGEINTAAHRLCQVISQEPGTKTPKHPAKAASPARLSPLQILSLFLSLSLTISLYSSLSIPPFSFLSSLI